MSSTRWRAAVAPVSAAAVVVPFAVMLAELVAQRPPITSYGDRAVTSIETRDLLRGRQLLGAYSRFGWHHPGPAFFVPLAAADVVLRGAHWAIDAGMLVAGAVAAAVLVVVVARAAGPLAAMVAAGTLGLYVRAVGASVFRDPWNPWGTLLPLALLTALGGAAGAGSMPALAGAVLVATVVVQTHLAAAPVAIALLAATGALTWWARRAGAAGSQASERAPLRRPAVWLPLAAAACLWVPPLVEEATGSDPNLTDLWRFFANGHPGQSLSTAVGVVGDRLGQLPLGSPQHFAATAREPARWDQVGGPLAVIGLYLFAGVALAVLGHWRGDGFARSMGVLTVVAVGAAVVAVHSAEGPLQGYVVGWATAVPIGCWLGAGSLLPRQPGRLATVGVALAGLVAVVGTATAAAAAARVPSARTESAPQVVTAWSELWPHLRTRRPGAVLLEVEGLDGWPVQAGLALELEEHGWQAHVTDDWVFMFGASRRENGHELVVAAVVTGLDGQPAVEVTDPLPAAGLRATSSRIATVLGHT